MERLPPILSSRLKHAFQPRVRTSANTGKHDNDVRRGWVKAACRAPHKRACRSAKNRDYEPNPYSPHAQAHAAEFAPLSEPYRTHDRFG